MTIFAAAIKYLPMILKLQSIAALFKKEQGVDKPGWLSRRAVGAFITFASIATAAIWGIVIDEPTITVLTESTVGVAVAVQGLYGIVMMIIGMVKKGK